MMQRQPEKVIAGLACDASVKTVLLRAIEVEPQDRYRDANAFRNALKNRRLARSCCLFLGFALALSLSAFLVSTWYCTRQMPSAFAFAQTAGGGLGFMGTTVVAGICVLSIKTGALLGTEKRERRVQWFSIFWALLWASWAIRYLTTILFASRDTAPFMWNIAWNVPCCSFSWMLGEDRRSRSGLYAQLAVCTLYMCTAFGALGDFSRVMPFATAALYALGLYSFVSDFGMMSSMLVAGKTQFWWRSRFLNRSRSLYHITSGWRLLRA